MMMILNHHKTRGDFFLRARDELVAELLKFLVANYHLTKTREEDFIQGLQGKRVKLGTYRASNKQIKWLLEICDRLDYRLSDIGWWNEMRVKYLEKHK